MIHLLPYDGQGYVLHFLVGVLIYSFCHRMPIRRILLIITVLALGKEGYDLLTDGALDVWDFQFSVWGVLAGKGTAITLKELRP